MSSCSRRQPRWDSRPSNNRHARPRRMPGGTFDHEIRSGRLKDASPFCYSSKIYSSPNKNNPNCKKRLACGNSASSRKCAGVCGTFRKPLASVRLICGISASFSQVRGAFAESPQASRKCAARLRNLRKHALFLKIVIDFVRKTSDSARRPRGEIRKTAFSVRNTYVRCG